MKARLIDLDNIIEGNELLESNEINMITLFSYILLLILIIVGVGLWFGKVDIVINGNGLIQPLGKNSIINNIAGGKVATLNFKNNALVHQGDIIYKIDSSEFDDKIKILNEQKAFYGQNLNSLNIFERSVNEDQNLLQPGDRYYNQFVSYDCELKKAANSLVKAEKEYLNAQKLGTECFSGEEIDNLKDAYQDAQINLDKFKSDTLTDIKNKIDEAHASLININNQLIDLMRNSDDCTVAAPIEGVIKYAYDFNIGDYILPNVKTLEIIPSYPKKYRVQIVIQNKDIGLIKVGQKIKYFFAAFPSNKFGTISGKISAIYTGVTEQQTYLIEGTMDKIGLADLSGNKTEVKAGMTL